MSDMFDFKITFTCQSAIRLGVEHKVLSGTTEVRATGLQSLSHYLQ